MSTDVLDISVENAPQPYPRFPHSRPQSPLPSSPIRDPELTIEPYVPATPEVSNRTPTLCIHTDVCAEPSQLSSPPSSSSHEGGGHISAGSGSTRSPLTIRPLPPTPSTTTTMTRPQLRRPRSSKAEEVRREHHRQLHRSSSTNGSHSRRLSRTAVSADDLRTYVHVERGGDRRSIARSVSSVTCEAADGCEIVQHHDGGIVSATIDLPPPYYECLRTQPPQLRHLSP
jgi:hypothetical protein